MTPEEEAAFVRQWEEEVSQLHDFALSETGKGQGGLLVVSDELAARYLAEVGVDVAGFKHLLDADGLRHIHKQHGGNTEAPRGQVTIVKQDVLDLRLVMTDPDTLTPADKSRTGLTRIEAAKVISGHTLYYVLEVRTGRRRLAPVTLYKRRKQ